MCILFLAFGGCSEDAPTSAGGGNGGGTEPTAYELSTNVSPTEAGSLNPSDGTFDEGEEVELLAEPDEGYLFVGWDGDLDGDENPATISMDSDLSVTALFERSNPFFLHENGVTIRCDHAEPGDVGIVNEVEYLAVNINLLVSMIEDGVDTSNACTTLVNNIGGIYYLNRFFDDDVSSWDVSGISSMNLLFYNLKYFDSDIGAWDVSDVTSMKGMFRSAESFNQNLSEWCVDNFKSEPELFSSNSQLESENKPNWGTCPSE